MSEIGHNTGSVDGSRLRAFVERIETVEEQIRDMNNDKKEIYSECKGTGYDSKIVKKIVAMRRVDRDKRIEEETILSVYLSALGMVD